MVSPDGLARGRAAVVAVTGAPFSTSRREIRYVILLLAVVNAVNYMDRMLLSILLPDIRRELLLSDAQLGLLTGFAFALFYAGFGLLIARWADRYNRRTIIAWALVVWSSMTALCGMAQQFLQLFLCRIGVGVGEAGCIPPSLSIISDYVSRHRRPGAIAVHSAGATVGTIIGLGLGGWLSTLVGWRWTFILLALPGLLLALVLRLTLRDPPRGYADGITELPPPPSLATSLSFFWHCKTYRWVVTIVVIHALVSFGMGQWMPSWYMRSYQLSTAEVGLYYGLAFGLGSMVGTLLGGFAANRAIASHPRFTLGLAAMIYAVACPMGLLMLSQSSVTTALLCNALFAIMLSLPAAVLLMLVQSVVQPNMRATAAAVMMLCASVFGIGGGPLLVGLVSDGLGQQYGEASLSYALMIPPLLLLPTLLLFLLASHSVKSDLANAVSQAASAHNGAN